jgi:hypothetical protein
MLVLLLLLLSSSQSSSSMQSPDEHGAVRTPDAVDARCGVKGGTLRMGDLRCRLAEAGVSFPIAIFLDVIPEPRMRGRKGVLERVGSVTRRDALRVVQGGGRSDISQARWDVVRCSSSKDGSESSVTLRDRVLLANAGFGDRVAGWWERALAVLPGGTSVWCVCVFVFVFVFAKSAARIVDSEERGAASSRLRVRRIVPGMGSEAEVTKDAGVEMAVR